MGKIHYFRVFLLVIVTHSCLSGFAETVAVGKCRAKLQAYTTISQAITSVTAGSTILVCPGTYREQITITKPLTLTGVISGNRANPRIVVPLEGLTQSILENGLPVFFQILVQGTETGMVNISNIAVDGSFNKVNFGGVVGILYHDASGEIRNIAISREFAHGTGFGMGLEATTSTPKTITVANCSIHGFEQFGLTAGGNVIPQSLTVKVISNSIESTNSLSGQPAVGGIFSNALGTISGNHIFTQQPPQGVAIEVQSNLIITNNTIEGGFVLAIWELGDSNTIQHNTMALVEGGIGVSGNNNVVLANSITNLPGGAAAIGFNCTGKSNTVLTTSSTRPVSESLTIRAET